MEDDDVSFSVAEMERIKEKLLSRVVEHSGKLPTPCWVWACGLFDDGYGGCAWNGKTWRAHRLAYTVFVGPIPNDLQVLHHCDERRCIRPEHTYAGTHQNNMDDMVERGGSLRGEANVGAILTELEAAEIKWLALEGHLTQTEIGDLYGVGFWVVSMIKLGRNWKHVEPKEPPPVSPTLIPNFVRRF